jgi:hypothetical protein
MDEYNIADEIEKMFLLLKNENLQPNIINNKLTVKIPVILPYGVQENDYKHHIISVQLPVIFEPLEYLKIINNIIECKNYGSCPYCGKNVKYGYYFDKYDGWSCTNLNCEFQIPHKRRWNSWS